MTYTITHAKKLENTSKCGPHLQLVEYIITYSAKFI